MIGAVSVWVEWSGMSGGAGQRGSYISSVGGELYICRWCGVMACVGHVFTRLCVFSEVDVVQKGRVRVRVFDTRKVVM